jgi:NhaP-type Na+/H+ or K+/H+ antiporter
LNVTAKPMCGMNYTRAQIQPRSLLVLSLAGLRGGTAFALALRWDSDATRIAPIETLTMGVIILTLCGAGESATLLLYRLE